MKRSKRMKQSRKKGGASAPPHPAETVSNLRAWGEREGIAPNSLVIEAAAPGRLLGSERMDLDPYSYSSWDEWLDSPPVPDAMAAYGPQYRRELPVEMRWGMGMGAEGIAEEDERTDMMKTLARAVADPDSSSGCESHARELLDSALLRSGVNPDGNPYWAWEAATAAPPQDRDDRRLALMGLDRALKNKAMEPPDLSGALVGSAAAAALAVGTCNLM